MLNIPVRIGKLEFETKAYKGISVAEKPSECFTTELNMAHEAKFFPPRELVASKLGVDPVRVANMESVLTGSGLLVGSRQKKDLRISEDSVIGRNYARTLFFFDYLEGKGDRNYALSSLPEKQIVELREALKETTGISEEAMGPQIRLLKTKGYLKENERNLVLNEEKWIKEKLVAKAIYEKGLEEYKLPANLVSHPLGDIKSVEDLLVRFSKCCNPLPGDPVFGVVDGKGGRGISVHVVGCKAVNPALPTVKTEWDESTKHWHPIALRVLSKNRPWKDVLVDLSACFANSNANVLSMRCTKAKEEDADVSRWQIEVTDFNHLRAIVDALTNRVDGVFSVERARPDKE